MKQEKAQADVGHDIIVIGTSVGGIEALGNLFAQLPATLPASILAVMHIHPSSPRILDRLLSAQTGLKVQFAEDGEALEQGLVYLAPPDCHLLVKDGRVLLTSGPRENRSRPAIDPLFRSAAVAHGGRVIGVVLTGLLDDGSAGLQAIKECGGITIVQDPKDAQYPEMPENALRMAQVDYTVPLAEMGKLLVRLVKSPPEESITIPEYLRLEVEISQGLLKKNMERDIIGELVPIVCPDCGGTLSAIPSENGAYYRCHEGHAYGEQSLLHAQDEKMEYALWTAVRVLDEQANMLVKMARRQQISSFSRRRYEERAAEIQAQAREIRNFLLHKEKETVYP